MNQKHGFSLVELSIVLVILGLLVGGILAGQSLIRASELRAVGSEFQRYQTAAMAFRDKYFAIPGDMANATSIWGRDNTYCASQPGTAAVPGTCNGDSNGYLDVGTSASNTTAELFQFWKQLALGGFIEGTYSGISVLNTQDAQVGVNTPRSRLSKGGWYAATISGTYGGDSNAFRYNYGNHFLFGAEQRYASPYYPVISPEEAWNIDTKLDDGKPSSGMLVARWWNNACSAPDSGTASATNVPASYRLSDPAIQCSLMFTKAF